MHQSKVLQAKRILQVLILWLMFEPAQAQEIDYETFFKRAFQADPRFALSLVHKTGDAQPVVMTAGPTVKSGTLAVAQDARWHIGSISKSFTSTLVMRLVERGVLSLDEPIGTYLTAYRENMHPDWRTLTLRQLLSHTAGLPANAPSSTPVQAKTNDPHNDRLAVLSAMWSKPGKSEVGRFSYSNIGYVLAGFIAEEVMGLSWESLILSEIAEPLGLTSLGFGAPKEFDAPRGHRSILGFRRPVDPQDPESDNPGWMGPAGTIHLSMADLGTWGMIHIRACKGLTREFLSQTSCQTMQSPVAENYGLGWVIEKSDNSAPFVWHNGSNTMWYALLVLIPEDDVAIAAATNVDAPIRVEKLIREVRTAIMDE